MKASISFLVSAVIAAFVAVTLAEAMAVVQPFASRGISSSLGAFVGRNQQSPNKVKTETRATTVLRSVPGDNDMGNKSTSPTEIDATVDAESSSPDEEEASLFDKINNFLDTPILDANNRSDQGALTEALKEFVRDEPEIAQVAFSAVVLAILVVLTKAVISL